MCDHGFWDCDRVVLIWHNVWQRDASVGRQGAATGRGGGVLVVGDHSAASHRAARRLRHPHRVLRLAQQRRQVPRWVSTDAITFSLNFHCFHGFLLVTFQFTKRSGSREGPMIRKTSWESTIASKCLPLTSHLLRVLCCAFAFMYVYMYVMRYVLLCFCVYSFYYHVELPY